MPEHLNWHKVDNIHEAMCKGYTDKPIVYAITNAKFQALYIGMTTKGFTSRYHGGTHNAINAAMDASTNVILLAEPEGKAPLRDIERKLIYELNPKWNQQNKGRPSREHTLKIEKHGKYVPKKFPGNRPECQGSK